MPNFDLFLGGGVPNSELWLEGGGAKFLFSFRSSPPPTLLNGTALTPFRSLHCSSLLCVYSGVKH